MPAIRRPYVFDPSLLRQQIQIQQQTASEDAVGQPLATWSNVLTTMAAIATQSMREVWQTAQFVDQVTHRITLRWPGASISIAGGMRVVYGTRVFQIQSVENVQERNRVLHLLCLEINGAA